MERLSRRQRYAQLRESLENNNNQNSLLSSNYNDLDNLFEDLAETEVSKTSENDETPEVTSDLFDDLFDEGIETNVPSVENKLDNELDIDLILNEENENNPEKENNNILSESIVNDFNYEELGFDIDNELDNNVIDSFLDEVNNYNKSHGRITSAQAKENLINSLSPSKITEEVYELNNEEKLNEEEEFNKTITLEVSKILNQLEEKEDKEISSENSESNHNLNNNLGELELIEDTKILEELPSFEETINPDTKLLNETSPIVISDEEIELDEDHRPNRILNFILIFLIILLIAILGFIAYIIMVAKGII